MRNQLSRWDPFDDLRMMRNWMDRLTGNVPVGHRDDLGDLGSSLALDVIEKGDQIVVKAALPGVDPEDIDVNVRNGMLHINVETRDEQDVQDGDYLRHEYRYGRFSRSIQLPPNVDADNADAKFENGML